jgi:translation initiation factor IF-1
VYVGWTGDVDNDTAGTVSQQYHDAGVAAKRDETCEVFCTVQSVRGDGDMSAARRDAVLVLGAIESALRGNISLGLEDLIRIEVSNGDVRQVRDAEGIGVEFDITITSTALI